MEDVFEIVMVKYFVLRLLCPDHELLKYFLATKDDFSFCSDIETGIDFSKRFKGRDVQVSKYASWKEYEEAVLSTSYGNYISELENAITEQVDKVKLN